MRHLIILLVLLVTYSCNKNESYQFDLTKVDRNEKYIILMHPTINNVRTFKYLVDNKIFTLPEGYTAIGVYHSLEKFDYNRTKRFLRTEGINNVHLLKIDSDLNPENIFKQNASTDIFNKLFDVSNGVIFFGGPDIPPACYNEPTEMLTVITDPHRHYLELSFLYHLLGGYQDSTFVPFLNTKPEYPILGICLGMQSMNVATGGTLIQDIPAEVYGISKVEEVLGMEQNSRHRNYQTNFGTDDDVTSDNYHQILIEKGSKLITCVTADTIKPYVLSSHHQCLERIGKGFTVTATSTDGKIVESINHKNFINVLGVQFHPEVTDLYKPEEKIKELPLTPAEHSYIDLYAGDKGENFQRAIWKKFGEKFK